MPAPRWQRRGVVPEEVARERDVLSADRRGVGEEIVGGRLASSPQVIDGVGHLGRAPPDAAQYLPAFGHEPNFRERRF